MDKGTTWTAMNEGFTDGDQTSVYTLVANGNTLYAGVRNKGIFVLTTDREKALWKPINGNLPLGTGIHSIAVSGNYLYVGSRLGVHRSADEGITWQAINNETGKEGEKLPDDDESTVKSLVVWGGDTICVGRYSVTLPQEPKDVFISVNGGLSWMKCVNGLPDKPEVRRLLITRNKLYAGTDKGVFLLTQEGNLFGWNQMNSGLADPSVFELVVSGNTMFAGASTSVWRLPLASLSFPESNPLISLRANPDTVRKEASNIDLTVEVKQFLAQTTSRVDLFYKRISYPDWRTKKLNITPGTTTYKTTLSRSELVAEEIGLEYYFEVTSTPYGKISRTPTATLGIYHPDEGIAFDKLIFGSQQNNYQIISLPLKLASQKVKEVLEDDLGSYDPKKWRIFSWREDSTLLKYPQDFEELKPGHGYLLLIKDRVGVDTGPGSTLAFRDDSLFTLELKRGWNLIGNPYHLNLSWNDIKKASGYPGGINNMYVFKRGQYIRNDTLDKLGGGFVWSESAVTLHFPVRRKAEYNSGRVASGKGNTSSQKDAHLEINFTLQSGELTYQLAGLGMHSKAKAGLDSLDEISPPQILQFLQLNFAHPEDFAGKFTKDMVPVQEQYFWEFTVESNAKPQSAVLQWENYFGEATEKSLLLYDVSEARLVDMRHEEQYRFHLSKTKQFRVYYGPKQWLAQTLKPETERLLPNAPNPFTEQTKLSFTLPERNSPYPIELAVFDLTGRKVATLANGSYAAGFYEIEWLGRNADGSRAPAGIYRVRLQIDRSRQYSISLVRR
jgi:hypothetical protein